MSRYAFTDLIASMLKRPVHERSQNFVTQCLWHDDRVPSLSIDLDRGLYYCFGCPAKGSLHTLAEKCSHPLDEIQVALKSYEATAGDMYEDRRDFSDLASELRQNLHHFHPQEIVDYIVNRNLSPGVIKHFGIGWKPFNKLIAMPYYDDTVVAGIKYRDPQGHKSMEFGSRRILYNVDDLRGRPTIWLAEGESDTHALWSVLDPTDLSIGIGGISGASVTKSTMELWSLDITWAKEVYLAFDADDAGDKAANIAKEVFGDKAIRARPTRGKDVTEHLLSGGVLGEMIQ